MGERYIAHRDPGDESDFLDREADRMAQIEYRNMLDTDPILHEQIAVSQRVVAEADTLPESLVAYHRKLLEYWGLSGTDQT